MLRSSAKSMEVIGCEMTENTSLITIRKSVPLSGDPEDSRRSMKGWGRGDFLFLLGMCDFRGMIGR